MAENHNAGNRLGSASPPGRCRTGRAPLVFALAAVLLPLAQASPLPPLPPRDFQGTYDPATGAVTLTWQPPDDRHDYHYVLYRGTTVLGTVEGLSHTDRSPSLHANTYLIQAVHPGSGLFRAQGATAVSDQSSVHAFTTVGGIVRCSPVVVGTMWGPPFASVGVRGECLL